MTLFSENPLVDLVITASLFLLTLIIIYSIANYYVSSRILRRYASHIRATMELSLVKKFVDTHRRIRIQVGEDTEKDIVKVFWVTSSRYPYVLVDVDKKSAKIIKAYLIRNAEDEAKYNPEETLKGGRKP